MVKQPALDEIQWIDPVKRLSWMCQKIKSDIPVSYTHLDVYKRQPIH